MLKILINKDPKNCYKERLTLVLRYEFESIDNKLASSTTLRARISEYFQDKNLHAREPIRNTDSDMIINILTEYEEEHNDNYFEDNEKVYILFVKIYFSFDNIHYRTNCLNFIKPQLIDNFLMNGLGRLPKEIGMSIYNKHQILGPSISNYLFKYKKERDFFVDEQDCKIFEVLDVSTVFGEKRDRLFNRQQNVIDNLISVFDKNGMSLEKYPTISLKMHLENLFMFLSDIYGYTDRENKLVQYLANNNMPTRARKKLSQILYEENITYFNQLEKMLSFRYTNYKSENKFKFNIPDAISYIVDSINTKNWTAYHGSDLHNKLISSFYSCRMIVSRIQDTTIDEGVPF